MGEGPAARLSRMAAGITSMAALPELLAGQGLQAVCLHGNAIARVECLQHLTGLTDLNLSSNALTSLDGLRGLSRLTKLNVASNQLRAVAGLDGLASLLCLNLSYNLITTLSGIAAVSATLEVLDLRDNSLDDLQARPNRMCDWLCGPAPAAPALVLQALESDGHVSKAQYATARGEFADNAGAQRQGVLPNPLCMLPASHASYMAPTYAPSQVTNGMCLPAAWVTAAVG